MINDYMLDLVPGEAKIYLSFDSPHSANPNIDAIDDIHTPEFLNTISTSGLPNHKLRLKFGLCNGIRMIITRLGKYFLEANVMFGSNVGDKVFIPRLYLTPSDSRNPLKFQRRQLHLVVSFTMSINKSQGQSLKHVGVYLPTSVFSYDQLYIVISRVTSRKSLNIMLTGDDGEDIYLTSNVVYRKVFRNL